MSRNRYIMLQICLLPVLLAGCGQNTGAGPVLDTSFVKSLGEGSYRYATVSMGTMTVSCEQYAKDYYSDSTAQTFQEISGKVQEVLVTAGAEVKKGDVIATLDTDYSAAYLEDKKLTLERTKENYVTEEELWQKRIVAAQTELGGTIAAYKENDHTAKDNGAVLDVIKEENKGKTVTGLDGVQMSMLEDIVHSAQGTLPGLSKDIEIGNIGLESQSVEKMKYELETAKTIQDLTESIARYERNYGSGQIVAERDGIIGDIDKIKAGTTLNKGDTVCTIRGKEADLLMVKQEDMPLPYGIEIKLQNAKSKSAPIYAGHVISSPEVCPEASADGRPEANYSIIRLDDASVSDAGSKLVGRWNRITITSAMTIPSGTVQSDKINGDYVELFMDGNVVKRYIDGVNEGKVYWVTAGLDGDEKIILRDKG